MAMVTVNKKKHGKFIRQIPHLKSLKKHVNFDINKICFEYFIYENSSCYPSRNKP